MTTKIPLLIGEKLTEESLKIDNLSQIDNSQHGAIRKKQKKNKQDIPNTYSKIDLKIFCNLQQCNRE